MSAFSQDILELLRLDYGTSPEQATTVQLYDAVSRAAMAQARGRWRTPAQGKRACYFSAEFLMGRMISANLYNMGLLKECASFLAAHGLDLNVFEEIGDAALGNGGLGRLAACFLDSAATCGVPMDGYGIRYRYGLFAQTFENGFQKEAPDDWQRFTDPWSVRREEDAVLIRFADQTVRAVPYDSPVIGYGAGALVNTLRLWQAEAVRPFDFDLFNRQKYGAAVAERDSAEAISAVLYPNDDTREGKRLRLKQQYFFSAASLADLVRRYKAAHGRDLSGFAEAYAVQLNDTHPTISIPELLRLLMEEGMDFDAAFAVVQKTFAYTNHTIMAEALEKWDVNLFKSVVPQLYPYVELLENALEMELTLRRVPREKKPSYRIICRGQIHMARMAIFATHSTNGVARIHTEIIKRSALPEWYALWPERFNNKTNGITQRRWLALCNPELSALITQRIGDSWITDLDQLKRLAPYADDPATQDAFLAVKGEKKRQLAQAIREREGFQLDPTFLYDIQIKRLHEYKRQFMNALSILDLYYGIKEGRITDLLPTAFLFGAKAAPGYYRAKGIIKLINEIARLVDGDEAVRGLLQVAFVQNYNVSYAEKLIPAAEVSEQISTAGTEASGTSNMKFMLNGAVTLGTYDGANIEIVEAAGEENNYIFGARVEDIEKLRQSYDPRKVYDAEPRVRRVLDALVDGTLSDGGTGVFRELYDSILEGASWHRPDQYYLLLDLIPYCETRLRLNRDARDRRAFAKKCLLNIANAGQFSSDRTIRQYAREIWGV